MKRYLTICLLVILLLFVLNTLTVGGVQTEMTVTKLNEADGASGVSVGDMRVYHTALADGFGKELENEGFILFLNKETANIALFDKTAGIYWYSSPAVMPEMDSSANVGKSAMSSHLIVQIINLKNRTLSTVNSYNSCVKRNTFKVEKKEDTLRIVYDFSREIEGFRIPVLFTLRAEGMDVRVDMAGIEEYAEALVTTIGLLPYFGCGAAEDNGFIFVPDGCGGMIDFGSGKSTSSIYEQRIYGRDAAFSATVKPNPIEITGLPVFGISREGGGFLAILDQGAALATVKAQPSGKNAFFNNAYATFDYRSIDTAVMADATWASKQVIVLPKKTSQLPAAGVSYRFTANGSIEEMAQILRAYEIERYGLTENADVDVPYYVELYGAIPRKTAVLGIIVDTIEPMTTFYEAGEIVSQLRQAGIENIVVKYNGVMKGGMDNSAAIDSELENKLGGNKGFNAFSAAMAESGISVYPDFEFQKIYRGRFLWSRSKISAKMVSGAPIFYQQFKLSTQYKDGNRAPAYLMSPLYLQKSVGEFLEKYNLQNTAGISAGSIGAFVYSDFGKNFNDRQASADMQSTLLAQMKKKLGNVMVSGGFDYAAAAATHVVYAPTGGSFLEVIARPIPFYSMVYRGLLNIACSPVNFCEDLELALLRCIESGITPMFCFTYKDPYILQDTAYNNLYSTYFESWRDKSIALYKQYYDIFNGSNNLRITGYEIIEDDLRVVTYEDGRRIAVNYADKPKQVNETIVPGRGFIVL